MKDYQDNIMKDFNVFFFFYLKKGFLGEFLFEIANVLN